MFMTNSKPGIGMVKISWMASKEDSRRFDGYEVAVHDEKTHTYEVKKFDVYCADQAIAFYDEQEKRLFGKER